MAHTAGELIIVAIVRAEEHFVLVEKGIVVSQ